MNSNWKVVFSDINNQDGCHDISDKEILVNLKVAASALNYQLEKGIPVKWINTHSLWSGGANALALAGYSDHEIQKMGH